jgi:hypothetical protein
LSLGSFAQSELGEAGVVGVEQWAEIRRLHFVKGLSQREIRRRTGLHRDTIRKAINSDEPPACRRTPAGSKLDPFKAEIGRLLAEDPKLPGVRVRELLEPLGCTVSKTVVDDYLREVRSLFAPPPRTFHRTVYRPGEICQFGVWQPRAEVPVGHGQTRRGWVVVVCLGYSRAGAGVLVFWRETEDLRQPRVSTMQQILLLRLTVTSNDHSPRGGVVFGDGLVGRKTSLAFTGDHAGAVRVWTRGFARAGAGVQRSAGCSPQNRRPRDRAQRTSKPRMDQTVGLMFLLKRNTLVGSHWFLISTSRANFSGPHAHSRNFWSGVAPAL